MVFGIDRLNGNGYIIVVIEINKHSMKGFEMSNTMSTSIYRNRVTDLIDTFGNKIFSVSFVKKTNGEDRQMQCRRHVKVGVKGIIPVGVRKEEDKRNAVLTVYDMQKITDFTNEKQKRGAFRRINLETVYRIKCQNTVYNVID